MTVNAARFDACPRQFDSVPLEVLDGAFVLLRLFFAGEGAEVTALARGGVLLPGVEAVFAGFEFADHAEKDAAYAGRSCQRSAFGEVWIALCAVGHPDFLDAEDLARVVDVDVFGARDFGQAGHEHHIAGDRNDEPCAGGERDVVDGQGPACGCAEEFWIIAERILGLGDADRQLRITPVDELPEFVAGRIAERHAIGAIDLRCDFVNLVFVRVRQFVDRVHGGVGVAVDEVDDGAGQSF